MEGQIDHASIVRETHFLVVGEVLAVPDHCTVSEDSPDTSGFVLHHISDIFEGIGQREGVLRIYLKLQRVNSCEHCRQTEEKERERRKREHGVGLIN